MKPASSTSRGSVLIVVLWASLGLVSVALLFGHSMLMNYRGVDNDAAGRQADQAIEGAIRYVTTLLTNEENKGDMPDTTSYEAEAVPVGEAEFWMLGRTDGDVNGTTRGYGLVDEASKINLNMSDTNVLRVMLTSLGLADDVVSAIIEWRTPSTGGVQNSNVKGAPFESVEELALVAGVTREILYGEDANLNGVLDANEDDGDRSLPKDNSDGKLDPGIYEYLTVFSKEPANRPGSGTTATPRIIIQSPTAAAEINTLFPNALPGRTAPAGGSGPGSSVASYLANSGLTEEDIDTLAPYLVNIDVANLAQPQPQPLLQGLVNVNTASEVVLSAVVGQDVAAQIVSTRAGRGTPSTGFAWVLPFVKSGQIAAQQAIYLTGQSYQVTADIAAVGRHGRGYRRSRVVFDFTADAPTIIYRRNLAPLGWALGRDIRQQLALKKDLR